MKRFATQLIQASGVVVGAAGRKAAEYGDAILKRKVAGALLFVGLVAVLGAAAANSASAQQRGTNPSGPFVYFVGPLTISPAAPPVGTYYTVGATVHSRHNQPLLIRVTIAPPAGDVANPAYYDRIIQPNSELSFSWSVYCGVDGGSVNAKVDILAVR